MSEFPDEQSESNDETQFLVLRITPYQSSSLIVTGLSPGLGQMGFFIRQNHKGKNTFAFFDLFRLLRVNYRKSRGELYYCDEVESLADFSALSQVYQNFQAACWLAKFALANILPGLSQPRFFLASIVSLQRLSLRQQSPAAVLTGLCLTYLEEAGCLDILRLSTPEAAQCRLLLRMAAGGDMPALTEENWQQLWLWSYNQLQHSECHAPPLDSSSASWLN